MIQLCMYDAIQWHDLILPLRCLVAHESLNEWRLRRDEGGDSDCSTDECLTPQGGGGHLTLPLVIICPDVQVEYRQAAVSYCCRSGKKFNLVVIQYAGQ